MIKKFVYFNEYYLLINTLPDKKQEKISLAILKYMFEDIEPHFEKDKQLYGIWINIKRPLETTKIKIENGTKGGRPKKEEKPKEKPKDKPKDKPKTNQKINDIYMSLVFSHLYINNIDNKNNIYKLFKEYLDLRTKYKYTITETVVKRLINKLNEYGTTDKEKIEVIENAINGAWKDFYPLKKQKETVHVTGSTRGLKKL